MSQVEHPHQGYDQSTQAAVLRGLSGRLKAETEEVISSLKLLAAAQTEEEANQRGPIFLETLAELAGTSAYIHAYLRSALVQIAGTSMDTPSSTEIEKGVHAMVSAAFQRVSEFVEATSVMTSVQENTEG